MLLILMPDMFQDPAISFETWAYRSVLAMALVVIGWLLVERFRQQGKIWAVVQKNKEASEEALAAARLEFTQILRDTMTSFRVSLEQLNSTVKEVGGTLRDLQITIGREYATRTELKEMRREILDDVKSRSKDD